MEMKTAFVKIAVLMLTLACLLSGCNLIEIDPAKQAEEDIAKIVKNFAVPAATYDGGEVTVDEAVMSFMNNYNETAYLYQMYFGYTMTEEDIHDIIQESLETKVQNEIAAAHFDAEYTLTDEEQAQAESDAQSTYDEAYEAYYASAEGKTDAQKEADTAVMLRSAGLNYENILAEAVQYAKVNRIQEMLMDEITEVTDEELQAAYEEKVSSDQEIYADDAAAFESAMTEEDTVVYWVPEGYRTVKHILVMPQDDVKNAYSDAVRNLSAAESDLEALEEELAEITDDDHTEEELAQLRTEVEIQANIDAANAELASLKAAVEEAAQACLADVKSVTDEIYARLEAGEDFEALMAEYGEDPGMQNEPAMSRGYYVSAASEQWDPNFTAGSMALANIGDYSAEPVVSTSGVHIIKYMSDAVAGTVALDDVRDALYEETLESMKQDHCDETLAAWVSEKNPSYDPDAFRNALAAE